MKYSLIILSILFITGSVFAQLGDLVWEDNFNNGKFVKDTSLKQSSSIELSNLKTGMHVVLVSNLEVTLSKKIIIQ